MDTMKRLVTGAVLAGTAVLGSIALSAPAQAATVPAADKDRGSVSTTSGSDCAQHALQRKSIKDFSG